MDTIFWSFPEINLSQDSEGTGSPKASNREYKRDASATASFRSLTLSHQVESWVVFHSAASEDPIRRTTGIS